MDWIDRESMDKQIEAYNAGLNKLLEVCEPLQPSGNQGIFPCDFEPMSNVGLNRQNLIAAATSLTVRSSELVDHPFFRGKPRVKKGLGPGSGVWDYNFFWVSFTFSVSVPRMRWEPGSIDEHGHRLQETRIASGYATSMRLMGAGMKWGLGSWYKKARDIRHYADAAKPKIREEYSAAYEKACEEVKKWEELVQAPKDVPIIPKPEYGKVKDGRLLEKA